MELGLWVPPQAAPLPSCSLSGRQLSPVLLSSQTGCEHALRSTTLHARGQLGPKDQPVSPGLQLEGFKVTFHKEARHAHRGPRVSPLSPPLVHFNDFKNLSSQIPLAAQRSLARPFLLASSSPVSGMKKPYYRRQRKEKAPGVWETATRFHKTHALIDTTPSPHIGSEKLLSCCQKFFYDPAVFLLGSFNQAGLCPHPAPKHREAEECSDVETHL